MSVHEFRPAIVGDGVKIDACRILANVDAKTVQSLAVVFVDSEGKLRCASTDGDAEALMLFERAKALLVSAYRD